MWYDAFATIARERVDIAADVGRIRDVVLASGTAPKLIAKDVAVAANVSAPVADFVLRRLVNAGLLSKQSHEVCRECRAPVFDDQPDACGGCGVQYADSAPISESYFTGDIPVTKPKEFWEEVANTARFGVVTAVPKEGAALERWMSQRGEVVRNGSVFDVGLVAGRGGDHRVVHAATGMGNTSAAVVATRLLERFPGVEYLIMVGIAGVVPDVTDPEKHARLGDVVVSNHKGVVEYDFVKENAGWTEIRAAQNRPSARLLEAVDRLERRKWDNTAAHQLPWVTPIAPLCAVIGVERPADDTDVLHGPEEPFPEIAHPDDPMRKLGIPRVHLAPIASAGTLQKNPKKRDELGKLGCRAVEMEGAGVAEAAWAGERGYLVIRGGCDYCDKFKSDPWQQYAAVVALAYLEALLREVPV